MTISPLSGISSTGVSPDTNGITTSGGITESGGGPSPFNPASMFDGGVNGWLFNGASGQSVFLQSAGGLPAGDGDPLGSVSDLSGNGNDVVQATGGSKPVCKVNGGISSIYLTSSKFLAVTFGTPVSYARTEIWVLKMMANSPAGECYPHVLSGTGGLDFQMIRNTATDVVEVWDGTFKDGEINGLSYGNPFIFVMQKAIGAGPDVRAFTYTPAGVAIDSDNGMAFHNTHDATSINIGFAAAMPPFHVAFSMGIEGHPDTTDLIAYLASTFGSWSPV